jgi:S-formylglutathione hydrolase FrmB
LDNWITTVPEQYLKAISEDMQGTLNEVTYRVNNYINEKRQLVTNQELNYSLVGRETVKGDAIHKKCNIYIPAGYDKTDNNKKYNVLYLLHGVGGNRYEWPCGSGNIDGNHVISNILDNLILNKEIEPLIVVFPEGRSAYDWTDTSFNSEGTNMLGFYYFDYELRFDLIPFIEAEYHTYSDINDTTKQGVEYNRQHRAIAGLSMGGMQTLNLSLGGNRCDSVKYTGGISQWENGLDATVKAPGMLDLFAYLGAFSNAPTSSSGEILGSSIATSPHKLEVLYLTCGDADKVAFPAGYETAISGLVEEAGDQLGCCYRVVIKDGNHDFAVWNNGAYNFLRLIFNKMFPPHREEYIL